MGVSARIFFVNENEDILKVPFSKWERFQRGDRQECFPEFRNKKVRTILAFVELQNKKPVNITHIDYFYTTFDAKGKLDQRVFDKELRDSLEMVFMPVIQKRGSNVINAEHKFVQKKYKHEHSWKPSNNIVAAIDKIIFQ